MIRTADQHVRSVMDLLRKQPSRVVVRADARDQPEDVLSTRAAGACRQLGVKNWADFATVTPVDILRLDNVGLRTYHEILLALESRGWELKQIG